MMRDALRFVPAFGLAACAALSASFWMLRGGAVPEADYRAVEAAVRAAFQPGDLVAVAPAWADRARLYLGDLPFVAMPGLAGEELQDTRRVWLIDVQGRGAAEAERLAAVHARERVSQFGALRLHLYALPARRPPRYDFLASAGAARVHVESAEGAVVRRCEARDGERIVCAARPDWHWVGPAIIDMGTAPRTCIWAHPPRDGTLVITYNDVPLGARIAGHVGIGVLGVRFQRRGAPVEMEVRVGGAAAGTVRAGNRFGFPAFEIDTRAHAGSRAEVSFRVRSARIDGRHFCFDARVPEDAP